MKTSLEEDSSLENLNNLIETKMNQLKNKFNKTGLMQETYPNIKERPALVKINKVFKNYGYINKLVIEPVSEDGDSEEDERGKEPSVFEVASQMVDYNTLMTLEAIEDFPPEATPSMMIINLDEWMTTSFLKRFIEETPIFRNLSETNEFNDKEINPEIESIVVFKYKKVNCGIVKFKNFSDLSKVYSFFTNPGKQNQTPTKNSKGDLVEFFLTYELSHLTLSSYYSVVLRNLPQNTTHEDVKSYCEQRSSGVIYALYPLKIRNSYCSIVVLRELDDAEKLCEQIKKEVPKDRKIKAHLHPRCCKIRRKAERSHFSKMLLRKDKIKFSDDVRKSELSVPKSKSLVKWFNLKEKKNLEKQKLEDSKRKEDQKETNFVNSTESKQSNTSVTSKDKNPFSNSLLSLLETKKDTAGVEIEQVKNQTVKLESDSKSNSGLKNLSATLKIFSNLNSVVDLNDNTNLLNTSSSTCVDSNKQGQGSLLLSPQNELKETPNKNIEEEDKKKIPNLSEKELTFYSYNFKDKNYFDCPPIEKVKIKPNIVKIEDDVNKIKVNSEEMNLHKKVDLTRPVQENHGKYDNHNRHTSNYENNNNRGYTNNKMPYNRNHQYNNNRYRNSAREEDGYSRNNFSKNNYVPNLNLMGRNNIPNMSNNVPIAIPINMQMNIPPNSTMPMSLLTRNNNGILPPPEISKIKQPHIVSDMIINTFSKIEIKPFVKPPEPDEHTLPPMPVDLEPEIKAEEKMEPGQLPEEDKNQSKRKNYTSDSDSSSPYINKGKGFSRKSRTSPPDFTKMKRDYRNKNDNRYTTKKRTRSRSRSRSYSKSEEGKLLYKVDEGVYSKQLKERTKKKEDKSYDNPHHKSHRGNGYNHKQNYKPYHEHRSHKVNNYK